MSWQLPKMFELREIFTQNQNTFYDNRHGTPVRTWPRLTAFVGASIISSFFLMTDIREFLTAINNVFSILLGFGFSVLFFLSSNGQFEPKNKDSIEQTNKAERINKLSREIFYNVSYFVVLSMLALAASLILVIPDFWLKIMALCDRMISECNRSEFSQWTYYLSLVSRALFSFLIIEATYTFFRLAGRVRFLFEQRLALLDTGK